ncbi:MAG: putative transporter substrate binding protein [Acidimicrobiales bacterium]|nr:putative transporter substrate binding protein [Acidimicrobiales bacterium]
MTRHPRRSVWRLVALGLALVLVAAACGSDDKGNTATGTGSTASGGDLTKVRLQLQWFPQSQFAGFFSALDEGYYKDEGLDVEILAGGVDIVPQQVLGSGQAEFAIAWVPKALASREEGIDITEVAQILQRSGTLQVSWKDDNLTTPASLKGKKVGNWGFGNEFELLAGLRKDGLDPEKDVELVQQNFDMQALLNHEIAAAQAMSYNEYGILLETDDPKSGKLYQPDQFNVINWNDVGTAMLQDAVWAQTGWLADHQDVAEKFLRASAKGWAFCRDEVNACVDHVVAAGSALDKVHMTYMLHEINALVWPSPNGFGVVDQADWDRTVKVALEGKLIKKDPGTDAFTNDIIKKATAGLDVDMKGADYTKPTYDLAKAKGK